MPTLLIYPGQRAEPTSLQAVLREAHDAARDARRKEIAARRERGVPLDDATRWSTVSASVSELQSAMVVRATSDVARHARAIADATEGNDITEGEDYVPSAEVHGVVVTMQIVSDATRRDHLARMVAAWAHMRDAIERDDIVARRTADESIIEAKCSLIVDVVVAIDGIDGMRKSVAESMPGLRLAGLIDALYVAARHFVDLPPGKALRCGQPAQ